MITQWFCPTCVRDVPLDHFAVTDCGRDISEDLAAAVLHSERSHYRFGKRQIGVTDLLGCPRKAAGVQSIEYAVNPLTHSGAITGTAYHNYLAKESGCRDRETEVAGVIEGVPVVTAIDRIDYARGRIVDDKTPNDYDARRAEIKPEHVMQLALGAELLAQSKGLQLTRGTVYCTYKVKPHQKAFHVDPLPSIGQVLDMKPLNGPTTVREHLQVLGAWQRGETKWSDMPLYGEYQSFGDKDACAYCPISGPCKEEARGAAF